MLNPTIGARDKYQIWQQLDRWTRLDVCPLEDPDQRCHGPSGPEEASRRLRSRRRPTGQYVGISSDSEDDSPPLQPPPSAPASAPGSLRPPILGPDPSAPPPTAAAATTNRKRSRRGYFRPRTIFHKALDAIKMNWENRQLKHILTQDVTVSTKQTAESGFFDEEGHLLWHGENLCILIGLPHLRCSLSSTCRASF